MVREFAREDERRVMLVLDPFHRLARMEASRRTGRLRTRRANIEERFERAVSHGRVHRLAFPRN